MIRYRSGYKYQLAETCQVEIRLKPAHDIETLFIKLDRSGLLIVFEGYAWDGPSGPAIDTKNFMRGSLVHDALYQLIREGWLGQSDKEAADRELQRICIEDGMTTLRAWWVYQGVKFGGGPSCIGDGGKPLCEAP